MILLVPVLPLQMSGSSMIDAMQSASFLGVQKRFVPMDCCLHAASKADMATLKLALEMLFVTKKVSPAQKVTGACSLGPEQWKQAQDNHWSCQHACKPKQEPLLHLVPNG